jgi:hypothetical protein
MSDGCAPRPDVWRSGRPGIAAACPALRTLKGVMWAPGSSYASATSACRRADSGSDHEARSMARTWAHLQAGLPGLAPDTHHTRRRARGRWDPPRTRGGTEGHHDASSPESDTHHRSGGGLLGRENAPQRCRTGPLAQFIALCRRSKWSKYFTNSPFLAFRAMVGSSAARKINPACSKAFC